ncbi:MAG: glycosyltransferase, partial [Alphaproteobacteria bacterium]|nr:glycosyltransferase [Alphaproteobacteria bacterium]
DKARIRIKNGLNLFNLEAMDWGLSPTWWQWSLHPKEYRDRISVIHDGIDTNEITPVEELELQMQSGIKLSKKDEIVTYVARNFEPYRGFPTAMRAFKIIQERRPNCHIIAVGGDEISYGKRPPAGKTYRQMMMEEVQGLDMSRLHFTGHLKYNVFLNVLKISRAHLYLTYPFVLSWSALEAMSAGCVVIGSDTEPVREVIEDGKNGLLVDFFSPQSVADRVDEVLDHKNYHQQIRDNARQTVIDRYDINLLLPLHMQLVEDLANRRLPPPAAKKIMQLYPDPPFQMAA